MARSTSVFKSGNVIHVNNNAVNALMQINVLIFQYTA